MVPEERSKDHHITLSWHICTVLYIAHADFEIFHGMNKNITRWRCQPTLPPLEPATLLKMDGHLYTFKIKLIRFSVTLIPLKLFHAEKGDLLIKDNIKNIINLNQKMCCIIDTGLTTHVQ